MLTFESDIFPALAGLVKQSQPLRKCPYYAGSWADSLAMDLLWRSRPPKTHSQSSIWRAPSWSWASALAPVDYYHIMINFKLATHMYTYGAYETFISDVVVECIPKDKDDKTIRLRSSTLSLTGHLVRQLIPIGDLTLRKPSDSMSPSGVMGHKKS